MRKFQDPTVAHAFKAYPGGIRSKLLALRELILTTAESTRGVGELKETLKWGEPEFRFEGNRAVVFAETDLVPTESLSFCVAAALTHHQRKAVSATKGLVR